MIDEIRPRLTLQRDFSLLADRSERDDVQCLHATLSIYPTERDVVKADLLYIPAPARVTWLKDEIGELSPWLGELADVICDDDGLLPDITRGRRNVPLVIFELLAVVPKFRDDTLHHALVVEVAEALVPTRRGLLALAPSQGSAELAAALGLTDRGRDVFTGQLNRLPPRRWSTS